MKVLAVADRVEPMLYTHFNRDNFPGVELILSCGDLPSAYLTFLVTVFNVPLYYVRGNHDAHYDQTPPQGCIDLHARIVTYRGIRLAGLEGSRWYNGGPHQYTDKQMGRTILKLNWQAFWAGSPDITIAHAPPRFIHDAEDPCHRGFKSFNRFIKRHAPNYFLHGHIHDHFAQPARRITPSGRTQIINTCGYVMMDIDRARIS
jgi:Icc-related predicted phosphoesterase